MPKLIGEEHASFIPRRQINDNIAIMQEIVHSMRNQKGRRGTMAIKVDLEKAYDILRWVFINETLLFASLPSSLVHLIVQCVSSTSKQFL